MTQSRRKRPDDEIVRRERLDDDLARKWLRNTRQSQTEAEVETAAARTLADTRASAETGTAGAVKAAVEGCRMIFGSKRSKSRTRGQQRKRKS